MPKSLEAFRTISEVADDLGMQKHVLRFWESKFAQLKPMKRGGGRRYYRPDEVELLRGIRHLLQNEGYTIKGVQKILRELGVDHVKACWQAPSSGKMAEGQAPVASARKKLASGGHRAGDTPDHAPAGTTGAKGLARVMGGKLRARASRPSRPAQALGSPAGADVHSDPTATQPASASAQPMTDLSKSDLVSVLKSLRAELIDTRTRLVATHGSAGGGSDAEARLEDPPADAPVGMARKAKPRAKR